MKKIRWYRFLPVYLEPDVVTITYHLPEMEANDYDKLNALERSFSISMDLDRKEVHIFVVKVPLEQVEESLRKLGYTPEQIGEPEPSKSYNCLTIIVLFAVLHWVVKQLFTF